MDTNQTTQQILASALRLSPEERVVIADALLVSVPLEEGEQCVADPSSEIESAWNHEIERRIDDIQQGRVETVPAEEAEKVIRGDQRIVGLAVAHLKRRPGYWRARKSSDR